MQNTLYALANSYIHFIFMKSKQPLILGFLQNGNKMACRISLLLFRPFSVYLIQILKLFFTFYALHQASADLL